MRFKDQNSLEKTKSGKDLQYTVEQKILLQVRSISENLKAI